VIVLKAPQQGNGTKPEKDKKKKKFKIDNHYCEELSDNNNKNLFH